MINFLFDVPILEYVSEIGLGFISLQVYSKIS